MSDDQPSSPVMKRRNFLKMMGGMAASVVGASAPAVAMATPQTSSGPNFFMQVSQQLVTQLVADAKRVALGPDFYRRMSKTGTLSEPALFKESFEEGFGYLEDKIAMLADIFTENNLSAKGRDELMAFVEGRISPNASKNNLFLKELGKKLEVAIKTGDFSAVKDWVAEQREAMLENIRSEEPSAQHASSIIAPSTSFISSMIAPRKYHVTQGDDKFVIDTKTAHGDTDFQKRFLQNRGLGGWVVRDEEDKQALKRYSGKQ